mmetsp:Transcript_41483/g.115284  ORF Transcript_41483/g.115284 Transcript_41483/m.115284 type:complete len:296 (-) Transcript_41483:226-1113(-)
MPGQRPAPPRGRPVRAEGMRKAQARPVGGGQAQGGQAQLPLPGALVAARARLPAEGLCDPRAADPALVEELGVPQQQTSCRHWHTPRMFLPAADEPVPGLPWLHEVYARQMIASGAVLLSCRVSHASLVGIEMAGRPHNRGGCMGRLAAPHVKQALVHIPVCDRIPGVMDVLVHVWPTPVLSLLLLFVTGREGIIAAHYQVRAVVDHLVNCVHPWMQPCTPCKAAVRQTVLLEESPTHASQLHKGHRRPSAHTLRHRLQIRSTRNFGRILHLKSTDQLIKVLFQELLKIADLRRI